MALTVETGSGVSNADSYISRADAVSYATARYGASDPFVAETDGEVQDRWLRQAAQALDGAYGPRLISTPASTTQGLLWPLVQFKDIYDRTVEKTVVPSSVSYAQAELARVVANGGELYPDLDRGGSIKSVQVDVISVEYMARATDGTIYQKVDQYMTPYLTGGHGGVKLVRGT